MHRESRDHPRSTRFVSCFWVIIGIEILGFFSNEECDKRFEDEKRRFASAQPLVISKSKKAIR